MNNQSNDDAKALEELLFDKDLERLEAQIAEFNIFEAMGVVRQELRHSDFLSFVLDPNQNHGLGDTILKRTLMHVLAGASGTPISAIDIDLMHLDQAEVMREWHSVDIFIHDRHNNIAVIIENKIGAGEHSGQLGRYLETVEREFLGATIIPIFLTPEGETPSHDAYLPVSYETIAEIIEEVCQSHESIIGQDVLTLMAHYTTMLRRHIVSDSEISELCRKLYRRHQRALDLIFEYRPDVITDISEHLIEVIQKTPGLVADFSSKAYVRFAPADWDSIPALLAGQGWTRSGRILLFQFDNLESRLALKLVIGPGDATTRELLYTMSQADPQLFKGRTSQLYGTWTQIYSHSFLSRGEVEGSTLEDLAPKINQVWQHFLNKDLPAIKEHVARVEFPVIG